MKIKICCISDRREVDLAIQAGADVLGFVGEQPSGPGRLEDAAIAELMAHAKGRVRRWLLTSTTAPAALLAQIERTGPDAVQICDHIDVSTFAALRARFPDLELIQVVHVGEGDALATAQRAARLADAVLLDSGVTTGPDRQLGGTGRIHDWSLSRRIVDTVEGPVWLAGGLDPDNVAVGVRQVRPAGVDLCSGVRDEHYKLDAHKLARFVQQVRSARGPIVLAAGASMAEYQRYIRELEAQHDWLGNDLQRNAFLMVEEVGELHAALRALQRRTDDPDLQHAVGEEIVDVLNYLLALANRTGIDLESAFRDKNLRNQGRSWE